ncbi:MAG: alcohol dehydrogenase catalytic domain-containing protein [Planctomycetaceae bacterium]
MRAVVFEGTLQFRHDVELRPLNQDDVIVDVIKAGICETDLQLCQGYMGFSGTLGHEFVGIARSGLFAGQRVAGEINCACHACEICQRQLPNHCPHRTVIGIVGHDGAFAESVVVPEKNLHAIPDEISDDEAVFVEPIAAACRIAEQIHLAGGEVVTVLGDGRLGNLCAQVLRHQGCQVRVIGKHEYKLNLLEQLQISTIRLDKLQPQRDSDIVVDCTGSPTGLTTALRLVRPCGTIILKTTVAADQSIHMAPFVIDEIKLIGSRCGPFAVAIELLRNRAISVEPLLTATYPLEEAIVAFRHAVRKDALKVVFKVR